MILGRALAPTFIGQIGHGGRMAPSRCPYQLRPYLAHRSIRTMGPTEDRVTVGTIVGMSTAFLFFVCWSFVGVAVAVWLARHGHNFWLFAAMGIAYGPLTAVIGWATTRQRGHEPAFIAEGAPWHGDGWLDVLVGLDGTDAACESVRPMIDRLSPAIRTLHLVSVLDHEITDSLESFERDDERRAYLRDAAESYGAPTATLALLAGQPDREITAYAEAHDIDMIVVGHRTQPIGRKLRGSTLTGLARHSELPVVVVPAA